MRVTLREVAAEAGVSLASASRALSGRPGVSPAVRRTIEDVSRRLDYQPSAVAASLRTRSTGALGMVIPDIANPFFPAIVQGVEREFARQNLTLVLCDTEENVEVEAARIETLLRQRVDALIVCPVDRKRSAPALRRAKRYVRVIQINRHALNDADFVGLDEAMAIAQVIEHIRDAGARTAVFVGLLPAMSSLEERAAGFSAACARFGVEASPTIQIERIDVPTGRAVARQFLDNGRLPDAIVCANDLIAFGVLIGLRDAGVRCPEDVLVSGYDDSVPAAELLGLTTVRQPLADIGREAARLLQQESSSPRTVRLTGTLVIRSTTTRSAASTHDA